MADDPSCIGSGAAAEELRQAAVYATGVLAMRGDRALQAIVERAAERFGAPIAAISIIDRDRQWLPVSFGWAAEETPRYLSFCNHAIVSPQKVMVVRDASSDARFASNALVVSDPSIRFYVGCPLVTGDGSPLGTLCAIDDEVCDGFGPHEEALLRGFTGEAMLEIERHVHIRRFGVEAIERIVDQIRAAAHAGDDRLLLALDRCLRSVEARLNGAWS